VAYCTDVLSLSQPSSGIILSFSLVLFMTQLRCLVEQWQNIKFVIVSQGNETRPVDMKVALRHVSGPTEEELHPGHATVIVTTDRVEQTSFTITEVAGKFRSSTFVFDSSHASLKGSSIEDLYYKQIASAVLDLCANVSSSGEHSHRLYFSE